MLIMRRQQGETILIGDEIEIVIAHIGRSKVKVGIRAPRHVRVMAKEVKVVGDANLAAARSTGRALTGLRNFPVARFKLSEPLPMSVSEGKTGGAPPGQPRTR